MSTQLDRIQWILDTRDISQRELARRAEIPPGHVGVLFSRLRANPNANLSRDTAEALAKGGGVRLAWLWLGQGAPEGPEEPAPSPPPPAQPHLVATLTRLRGKGRISAEAEAVVMDMASRAKPALDEEIWAMIALSLQSKINERDAVAK